MFITNIEVNYVNSSSITNWDFEQGTGAFKNSFVLFLSQDLQTDLLNVMEFIFTSKNISTIETAKITLVTNNGDEWHVEKNYSLTKYLKNSTFDAQVTQKDFLAAIFDIDVDDVDSTKYTMLNALSLMFKNGEICQTKYLEKTASTTKNQHILSWLEERNNKLLNSSDKHNEFYSQKTLDVTREDLTKLNKLKAEAKALSEQKVYLKNMIYNKKLFSKQEDIDTLRAKLQVVSTVKNIFPVLLKNSSNIKNEKTVLEKLNSEINAIKPRIKLKGELDDWMSVDWRVALETLVRLEAYDKILKSTKGVQNICKDQIQPLISKYIESIASFKQSNSLLLDEIMNNISEFESGLANINLENYRPVHKQVKDGVKGWIEKIKTPKSQEFKLDKSNIEQLQHRLEYIYNDLSKLLEQTSKNDLNNKEQVLNEISESFEKTVISRNKIHESWLKVADEFSLDKDMALKDLLRLIYNIGQITILYIKRENIKLNTIAFDRDLEVLKTEITTWHNLNNTQPTSISQQSIIFVEARDISAKEKLVHTKLNNIIHTTNEQSIYNELLKNTDSKLHLLEIEWHNNLSSLGFDSISLLTDDWHTVASNLQQIIIFKSLQNEMFLSTAESVSIEKGAIVNMFLLEGHSLQSFPLSDEQKTLKTIIYFDDVKESFGLNIICTELPFLLKKMKSLGYGSCHYSKRTKELKKQGLKNADQNINPFVNTRQVGAPSKTTTSVPVRENFYSEKTKPLSPKAKEALNAFNYRRK